MDAHFDLDDLDDLTVLRAIQHTLSRVAVALVRTEHNVTQLLGVHYPSRNPARGDEMRVSEVLFASGSQQFGAQFYTGRPGATYEAHPAYVLQCSAPAGMTMLRHWHPDVHEYLYVISGEVVNLANGKRAEPGESLEVRSGETHQMHFPVDTTWRLVFELTSEYRTDAEPNQGGGDGNAQANA